MVAVFRPDGRRYYYCQWRDKRTGQKVTRSTRSEKLTAACIAAAQLSADAGNPSWPEFQTAYQRDILAARSDATREKHRALFRAVDEHVGPIERLTDLDAPAITRLTTGLRSVGLEDSTIRGHLDNLRAALKWATEQGYLSAVPKMRLPARGGMRGRPLLLEEFERYCAAVKPIVGRRAKDYVELVEGLWLSGLRLFEAHALSWDHDSKICVDLTSYRRPMFRIAGDVDKGRKERVFPIAPEFVEWLQRVPANRRRGFVFFRRNRPSLNWTSKRLSEIGERARIKVKDERGKLKWASAHDLRRSFGFRWAQRVPAPALMALMRHASITTTMKYYVGANADAAADVVWNAYELQGVNRCPV